MSPSVSRRSSKGHRESKHSVSPARGRARHPQRRSPSKRDRSPDGSPRRSPSRRGRSPASSPRRRSPYRRERPPAYHKSSLRGSSPTREKHSGRNESPILEKSNSPEAGSPSPRTKRLRRAQAEKEVEKAIEREREGSHRRGSDKSKHQDRGSSREGPRRERRSERDGADGGSSRSRHGRSTSPSDYYHRSHHHSHSPPPASNSRARDEGTNSRGTDDCMQMLQILVRTLISDRHAQQFVFVLGLVVDDDSLAKMKAAEEALESKKKHQPSFELSGKLAAETNRVKGITLLFNEPPDARKPNIRWRLYVFKAGEVLNEPLYVHRQSCYLFGRERRVADIPTDHPSCSKQHAVLQFRQVEKEQPDGMMSKQTRPYLMDLGSTNKTFINDSPLEPQRYYELFEKDTIKFGNSSREYVLLHENSLE